MCIRDRRYGEPIDLTGDAEADTAALKSAMQVLLEQSRREYDATYGPFTGEAWMPKSMGGTAPTIEESAEMYRLEKEARAKR